MGTTGAEVFAMTAEVGLRAAVEVALAAVGLMAFGFGMSSSSASGPWAATSAARNETRKVANLILKAIVIRMLGKRMQLLF